MVALETQKSGQGRLKSAPASCKTLIDDLINRVMALPPIDHIRELSYASDLMALICNVSENNLREEFEIRVVTTPQEIRYEEQ